jgi:uncharacterized membrane protein YhaH (DUF805 family)
MDLGYLFTSARGRINRKPYWIGTLILMAISIGLGVISAALMAGSLALGLGLLVLGSLALLVPAYFLLAKRLQDRNRPPALAWLLLGPAAVQNLLAPITLMRSGDMGGLETILNVIVGIIAIWFLIELGFLRGTPGPNRFGPDPLDPNRVGTPSPRADTPPQPWAPTPGDPDPTPPTGPRVPRGDGPSPGGWNT